MAVDTRPYVTFSDPTLWQRVFRIRPTRKDSISKALPWSVSRLESIGSHPQFACYRLGTATTKA